ncbi:MAG: hypothetical protein AAFN77_24480 [Planctomycetota bacterium]
MVIHIDWSTRSTLLLCVTETFLAIPAFNEWPSPESPMLSSLVEALRSRSKSLNNRVHRFNIELTWESVSDTDFERLNLELENGMPRPNRLTFAFWDDGALWIDARQPSKSGWQYGFSFYGTFDNVDAENVREMIEHSMWISNSDDMKSVWHECEPYTE